MKNQVVTNLKKLLEIGMAEQSKALQYSPFDIDRARFKSHQSLTKVIPRLYPYSPRLAHALFSRAAMMRQTSVTQLEQGK